MIKSVSFKTKGMQRDLSASAFNPEYAFENKNIRIYPTNDNTLLSIINEKGTELAYIQNIGYQLSGHPIGQAIINDILVIFTKGVDPLAHNSLDRIYKVWMSGDTLYGEELYAGSLGFDVTRPLETLACYENDRVQKIYWTDGYNQPRVINIAADSSTRSSWNDNSFDFIKKLSYSETVTINKNSTGSGQFASGTIQYAFTYYNKYGQESNIFYTSPLFYISYENNGASPEDTVSNSFNISIQDADSNFQYIRVYSIHRTSIDATPTVKVVVDLEVSPDNIISFTDNGTQGYVIDPTQPLYVGGEMISAGTITQKDNTLFLGDINLIRPTITENIKNTLKGLGISFSNRKRIPSSLPKGSYSYKNQLISNSSEITTFKYLEWYRFGVQFQHYTGKWSEPVFIGDYQNTMPIADTTFSDSEMTTTYAELSINNVSLVSQLKSLGYVRVRPIIVYPSLGERSVICQGILCPTIFNVQDRYTNSPFAQSSWFSRPNPPFNVGTTDFTSIVGGSGNTIYSKGGVMQNDKYNGYETINKGAWAEFRHLHPIPPNNVRNAEIQCIWQPPETPSANSSEESVIQDWVSKYSENYYIDQSIITMHSPDIEFDDSIKNLDTSGLKLRIVGLVPLTACSSDIDIQTSTTVEPYRTSKDPDAVFTELPAGFYKESIGTQNDFTSSGILGDSHYAFRGLISGVFWFDELSGTVSGYANPDKVTTAFAVYPWHRNGSMNNCKYPVDGHRPSMLKYKKMSNTRYSYRTKYLEPSKLWNAYVEGSSTRTGISGVTIFNSDTISNIRIPAPENSSLPDINYYGNIDKVELISRQGIKAEGYPIMISGTRAYDSSSHYIFTNNYTSIDNTLTEQITGVDPVSIKYKSTPHAVMALNFTKDGKNVILPCLYNNGLINNTSVISDIPFYAKGIFNGIQQDYIAASMNYGFLWLGELYRDIDTNTIFGGKSEEAINNNQWLPCGEPASLVDQSGNPYSSVPIKWTEGDTYYQRYDHIKTYPFTLEDQNSVTEIISFMCETRVNIDGRYDKNRGQTSNLAITPQNFNKLNTAYSQNNNFFTYRGVDSDLLKLNYFPNQITWTKTKTIGEQVDTWTNINLSSTLDLDGDKGRVTALRRFNNNLIAFQDKGISAILYNETFQFSTTEGVPVEIGNSGKVNGKRYITNRVGCANKWSICESQNGIYFTDDITKGIYLYNGNLTNITDQFGFHSWINTISTEVKEWNPQDFNNMVTYQDKVNGDIFFITRDQCLAFSEPMGGFTSFYSYENTPFFCNLQDKGLFIKPDSDSTCQIWLHNEGQYNMFFDNYEPFYTTVVVNPDINVDKIFNNIEFTSDSWDSDGNLLNTTFDTLDVWNEYQSGTQTLQTLKDRPSTLKKKFRVWRANIPRDRANNRDRIRNTWVYLKLSKQTPNTDKTVLHSLSVDYFQ